MGSWAAPAWSLSSRIASPALAWLVNTSVAAESGGELGGLRSGIGVSSASAPMHRGLSRAVDAAMLFSESRRTGRRLGGEMWYFECARGVVSNGRWWWEGAQPGFGKNLGRPDSWWDLKQA